MPNKLSDGLVKRGSTWSYVVRVADPATGKTKPVWKGGFATKSDARRARDRARTQDHDGAFIEPTRLTLGQFLVDRWLPARELDVRATTLLSYRLHVDRYIVPRLGGVKLQALRADQINALYAALLADGGEPRKGQTERRPLAPRTVLKTHTVLRRSLSDAVRWGLIVRNPVEAATRPRPGAAGEVTAMTVWTASELGRFLAATANERTAALWAVLSSTGMRRGEALGLRWTDVDLDVGTASIRQNCVQVGYELLFTEPKTRRSRRTVDLDRGTVTVLRTWRKQQLEERVAWGPAWTDTGLVFTRENGEVLHPDRASKLFDRRAADLGLPSIRLHDLRHTWATLALEAGVHPKVVSDRLGHATVGFTLDVYTHAVPRLERDAAEKVARLIAEAGC